MFQNTIRKPNKLNYSITSSVLSLKKPIIVVHSDNTDLSRFNYEDLFFFNVTISLFLSAC